MNAITPQRIRAVIETLKRHEVSITVSEAQSVLAASDLAAWQPIETRPMGVKIDVWIPDGGLSVAFFSDNSHNPADVGATHWAVPRPEPVLT